MLQVNCPHCRHNLQIPVEYAGKTGTCVHCQKTFTVPPMPAFAETTEPAAPVHTAQSRWLVLGAGIVVLLMVAGAYLLGKQSLPSEQPRQLEAVVQQPVATNTTTPPEDRLAAAHRLAKRGKYDEAVAVFEKVRAEYPQDIDSVEGLCFAIVYAQLKDHEKHEALCRWMFDLIPGDDEITDAERTGKAYLLYPGADDPGLLAEAAGRIEYGAKKANGWQNSWFNVSLGIAKYRAKQYGEAEALFKKELNHENATLRGLALGYCALAAHSRGDDAMALEMLARAQEANEQLAAKAAKNYWDVLASQLAFAEAESALGSAVGTAAKTSNSAEERRERALQLAREDKYQNAVELLNDVIEESPDLVTSHDAVIFGIVFSLMKDETGHKTFSNWVLDKFSATKNPFDAEHAAKAYLVYPNTNDKELLDKSVALSQVGVDNVGPEQEGRSWIYLSHAMAKYRLNAYDEAGVWLNKTIDNTDVPAIITLALGYTALNQCAMGNPSAAAGSLKEAKAAAENLPPDAWEHIHHAKIVVEEAEAALNR